MPGSTCARCLPSITLPRPSSTQNTCAYSSMCGPNVPPAAMRVSESRVRPPCSSGSSSYPSTASAPERSMSASLAHVDRKRFP